MERDAKVKDSVQLTQMSLRYLFQEFILGPMVASIVAVLRMARNMALER